MRSTAIVALLVLSASAGAQSRGTTITGVVFDSVANAPLPGAVVQVVQVDSSAGGRNYTVVADALGRYRLEGLPHGKFGIGFQHLALTALGLESPLRAFQIANDTTLAIDLGIPSAKQVRAEACPGGSASDGMLAGLVSDATRSTLPAGATVTVGWTEVGVVDKKLQAVPKRSQVKVGEDGAFIVCGLASESPLVLEVAGPGYRSILSEITIPEAAALRRDFLLADTAKAIGGSAVVGTMMHEGGKRVASGRVSIPALDVDVPVDNGSFTVPSVPPGTWQLEARVIGYEPQSLLVDVREGAPASVTLLVDRKVQLLDAITVVGKVTGDIKVLNDLVRRNRASTGTLFMPNSSWLQTALYPADVLRAARGFMYRSFDDVRVRGCNVLSLGGTGGPKTLKVYVDGVPFAGGIAELTTAVNMREVLAIEAFPDMMGIPSIYFSSDACAVVAVWTKRN